MTKIKNNHYSPLNKIQEVLPTSKPIVKTFKLLGFKDVPVLELAHKPNYKRLEALLSLRTHSKGLLQDRFIQDLQQHFNNLQADTYLDEYGSLYVTKGSSDMYPCVVAHTDINQSVVDNVKILTCYPWIFGLDADTGEQCGLGADDKVGVYFALHMFDLFDNIKLFFPKDEEVGLIGTYQADQSFFENCTMMVQLDRRSTTNDLITYTNGITVCSEEFVTAAQPIMNKYMYATNNGSCTDIGGIKTFSTVSCIAVNVSCGYVNEHMDNEVISIPHFENAINFGYELLTMGNRKWEHVAQPKYQPNAYQYKYGTYYDDLYAPSSNLPADKYFKATSKLGTVTLLKTDQQQDEIIFNQHADLQYAYYREHMLLNPLENPYCEHILQEDIDSCLQEHFCPSCYNPVKVNNRLLLHIDCPTCGQQWNSLKENINYSTGVY